MPKWVCCERCQNGFDWEAGDFVLMALKLTKIEKIFV